MSVVPALGSARVDVTAIHPSPGYELSGVDMPRQLGHLPTPLRLRRFEGRTRRFSRNDPSSVSPHLWLDWQCVPRLQTSPPRLADAVACTHHGQLPHCPEAGWSCKRCRGRGANGLGSSMCRGLRIRVCRAGLLRSVCRVGLRIRVCRAGLRSSGCRVWRTQSMRPRSFGPTQP